MSQVQTEAKPMVTRNQALGWLRQMLLIRRFEERSAMLYQKQKIGGFCHLYSGQEPVAVGSIGVLREDDYVITAYRDHGHALARGMEPKSAMAELLGKATGCSKGKGGSMHFFDAEKGFLGGHAIVGSHIPLAAGVGLRHQVPGEDRVCICYFGDGAMNQGSLHEAFNMAALWKLPVIYVVENNLMSMGTQLHRHSSACTDLTVRGGTAYGMPGILDRRQRHRADGPRPPARRPTAPGRARGRRSSRRKTYRFRGHSMSDPAKYRPKEELDEAKERDPIVALRERAQGARLDRRRHDRASSTRRSSTRSTRRSSSPSRARSRRSRPLYEDVTVAPYIPQE